MANIKAAKERQEEARRKLDRRGLDERALETQRPIFWNALIERIGNAVGQFNEDVPLARPIQFTKKSDRMVSVTKEGMPFFSINLDYQESQNRILYNQSTRETPGQSIMTSTEIFTFDVDEDGQVWLLLHGQRLNIDDAADRMVTPLFETIT